MTVDDLPGRDTTFKIAGEFMFKIAGEFMTPEYHEKLGQQALEKIANEWKVGDIIHVDWAAVGIVYDAEVLSVNRHDAVDFNLKMVTGPTKPHEHACAAKKTNFDRFCALYEACLRDAIVNFPDEYAYPASQVSTVSGRMRDALKRGSYNKDSRAFKATCKVLGIKHTYTAINEYIADAQPDAQDGQETGQTTQA